MARSHALLASLSLVTILSLQASSRAQLIVGNDQSGVATIYNINPTTGVSTPIYSSSTAEAKPWGMAYNPASNTLYWNNGATLYSSPLQATLVPTALGSLTFNGSSTNYVALAFADGKLLGTRNIATEAVYSIDLTTLAATSEYVYPSTFDFGGLDTDATTGKVYGLTDNGPVGGLLGLYSVDIASDTTSFIAPYPAGETDIDGLAVHGGRAYYVTDGPNTAQANFYVFDVATGAQLGTIPSPFTGSGTFSAATFALVPEPTSLAAMTMLAAAARRRRR